MGMSSNHRWGLANWLVPGLLFLSGCGLLDGDSLWRPFLGSSNPKLGSDNMPTLRGSSPSDSTLEVFLAADCAGEPALRMRIPDGVYSFEFSVEVPDDSVTVFSVRATRGEEASGCSEPFTYREDSTPPAAPTSAVFAPPSPNRTLQPWLEVSMEPGVSVSVFSDADCTQALATSLRANDKGRINFNLSEVKANDTTTLYFKAQDEAKNISPCYRVAEYVHDSIYPANPVLEGFFPKSPANENAPRLRGTAEPGTTLSVFRDASTCLAPAIARLTVGADGTFEVPLSVADNSSPSFTVQVEDAARNPSACIRAGKYVEDSLPPLPPVLAVGSPKSPNNSRTPSLQGTVEAGTYAVLLLGSADCSGGPLAAASSSGGTFTLNGPLVVANTATVFSLEARDEAGNRSTCVGPVPYVHDSLPPSAVAAIVEDGPAEDLDVQLDGILEAHWSGFTDADGVAGYQFAVGTQPRCLSGITTSWQSTSQPGFRQNSSSDGVYYTCVRALDAAGNVSDVVGSDGVRVDTQPPRIVSHTPRASGGSVDVRSPVSISFSEPMDAATVPGRLTLTANGVALQGAVACASQACTFTPAEPLPYLETVTVSVDAQVKDIAGRPLGTPYSFSFTTRGRNWSQQISQLSPLRPAHSPEVALDGQGRALAIWAQGLSDGSVRVYSSAMAPASAWTPAQALDAGARGNAARPALAMNASGRAMAAWELQSGAQADLMAAEYQPATGWSVPGPVEGRAEPVSHPRLGVDGQGRTVAVWRQSDGTAESLWAAHHVPGQGWGAPVLLELEAGEVTAPALAVDSSGNARVAWLQPDTGGLRVLTRGYSPAAGWSPPAVVSSTAVGPSVAVALSAGGSALVLFRRPVPFGNETIHRVHAARQEGTQGWSAPVPVSSDVFSADADFTLAMDAQGVALAVWNRASSTPSLHTCRFTPEQGWEACQSSDGKASQPSVGVDGGGNFILAWVFNASGTDYAVAARYPASASALGALSYLEFAHAGASKRPRLAVNAAGGAAVVWARDNGTGNPGNLVYASTFE